jgi:hypothetical protein
MRFLALLMLPSGTFPAPVPKQTEKPGVELKLSAGNQDVLDITIQNNDKEPLELSNRVTALEHLVVDLLGENGKQSKIQNLGQNNDKPTP